MQAKGTLSPQAEPEPLAIGLMAALQGGYLLANTAHDVRPMEIALDLALDHLKSYLTEPSVLGPFLHAPNADKGEIWDMDACN